jgi:ATP-dependent 26S proteasome regulatory subunit
VESGCSKAMNLEKKVSRGHLNEVKVLDKRGRLELLQIHTRNMSLDRDVDHDRVAAVSHGFLCWNILRQ